MQVWNSSLIYGSLRIKIIHVRKNREKCEWTANNQLKKNLQGLYGYCGWRKLVYICETKLYINLQKQKDENTWSNVRITSPDAKSKLKTLSAKTEQQNEKKIKTVRQLGTIISQLLVATEDLVVGL